MTPPQNFTALKGLTGECQRGPGNAGEDNSGARAVKTADAGPFHLRESWVMARLGIRDKEVQRVLRQKALVEGEHWMRDKNRIMYSAAAQAVLAQHIRICPQDASASADHHPSPSAHHTPHAAANPQALRAISDPSRLIEGPQKRPQLLQVIRSRGFANNHVLLCLLPGDPNPRNFQTVRVRDNRNFVPGTKTGRILAVHEHGNLWAFAGNPDSAKNDTPRCPRFKGKW